MLDVRMNQLRSVLLCLMLAVLAAILVYFGFRGYFSPELLFNFSNSLSC